AWIGRPARAPRDPRMTTGALADRAVRARRRRSWAERAIWTVREAASRCASAPAALTLTSGAAAEARSAAARRASARSTPSARSVRSTARTVTAVAAATASAARTTRKLGRRASADARSTRLPLRMPVRFAEAEAPRGAPSRLRAATGRGPYRRVRPRALVSVEARLTARYRPVGRSFPPSRLDGEGARGPDAQTSLASSPFWG